MPSPVGHALGGLAVGFAASRDRTWALPLICAAAAALPDLDLVLPLAHRGPTHSLMAGVIAGGATSLFLLPRLPARHAMRVGVAIGLAVVTHVLFDWLAADSAAPRGLMAFWPFTRTYYISDLDLFSSVERRYWRDDFLRRNAIALARELALLVPIVWVAWRKWSRR